MTKITFYLRHVFISNLFLILIEGIIEIKDKLHNRFIFDLNIIFFILEQNEYKISK
jgi:hypothetical protein